MNPRPLPARRALRAALGLLLAIGGAARADVVHLRNGGQVEGRIVSRDASSIVVKTSVGTVTIAAADVARIDRKTTPLEELERKREALDPKDADGRVALADWAAKNGLGRERTRLLEEAVAIDAGHEAANRALGRVRVGDRWMTPSERDSREREAAAAEARGAGRVQYQGRWVTPEEKDALEKGLKLKDGKWMTEDEIMALDGLVRFRDRWVKKEDLASLEEAGSVSAVIGVRLETDTSENFTIQTAFGLENAQKVLLAAEEAYAVFRRRFGVQSKMWKGKCRIVLLEGRDEYVKYAEHFEKANALGEGWLETAKMSQGYYHFSPPAMVDVKLGRHEDDFVNAAVHKVGHVCVNLLHFRTNYVPQWIDEGVAALLEQQVTNRVMNYCFSSGYGSPARGIEEKWLATASWRDLVSEDVGKGSDTPLDQLFTMDWNSLRHHEIAKSVSLISWLMDRDPRKFDDFLKKIRDRMPFYEANATPKVRRGVQAQAMVDALGKSSIEIENEWRRFVRSQ